MDITVIRSWMGHAHIDTTNLYAEANIETKREALKSIGCGSQTREAFPLETERRYFGLVGLPLMALK